MRKSYGILKNMRFNNNIGMTVGLLFAAAVVVYAQSSWSGPTAAPPGNNTPAPLNVSAVDQLKDGGLGLGRLAVFGGGYVKEKLGVGVVPGAGTEKLDVRGGDINTDGVYRKSGVPGISSSCATGQVLKGAVVSGGLVTGGNCAADGASAVGESIPSGAIMPFYLSSCPTGWMLADGTNGTPDLRGAFIRGLGDLANSRDPEGSSRALGSFQLEDFKRHSHTLGTIVNRDRGKSDTLHQTNAGQAQTGETGGPETRPDNVALLYCQKSEVVWIDFID